MGSQTRLQGQLLNVGHETFNAAMVIHGGTEINTHPAIEGMFNTLCKRSKLDDMTKLVSSNEKLQSRVASDHCSHQIRSFETSNENVLGSIACYYSGGVMGKESISQLDLFWQQRLVEKSEGAEHHCALCKKSEFPNCCHMIS